MNNPSYTSENDTTFSFQERGIILNYSELMLHISDLKAIKLIQEEELKSTFSGLVSTLNIISIFKKKPFDDQSLGLVKLGLNKVIEIIIDFAFGRNKSLKGYLSSVLVSKFATTLIDTNLVSIISGVSSLIHRHRETKNDIE